MKIRMIAILAFVLSATAFASGGGIGRGGGSDDGGQEGNKKPKAGLISTSRDQARPDSTGKQSGAEGN